MHGENGIKCKRVMFKNTSKQLDLINLKFHLDYWLIHL